MFVAKNVDAAKETDYEFVFEDMCGYKMEFKHVMCFPYLIMFAILNNNILNAIQSSYGFKLNHDFQTKI